MRNVQRLRQTTRFARDTLAALTRKTSMHIVIDVSKHTLPPKGAVHIMESFVNTKVASIRAVMEVPHESIGQSLHIRKRNAISFPPQKPSRRRRFCRLVVSANPGSES